MALDSRNAEAERLAQQVATLAGETKTAAVTQALRERLERRALRWEMGQFLDIAVTLA